MTTMATPTPDALRHSILEGLRRRLRPVQRIDTDARRYAQEREAFKAYLFGRFGLASLAAQGEESSVRRVVHAHLLAADAEYRGWVEDELPSLADPWSTADPADRFAPVPARLTSASQRDAYLPAAKAGRAAVDRAMGQLELGLEVARRKVEEAQEEEEAKAARAALVVREGRLAEMAGKRERFDAVLAVLSRIDGRLVEAREEALSRLARRQSSGGGVAPSSSPPPPPPRDTSAWGKAAEREAEAAMEAVVAEVNDQLQGSGGPPLRLLSSVLFKGLDGDDMVRLREAALAEGRAELYGTEVERPKGDVLHVCVCFTPFSFKPIEPPFLRRDRPPRRPPRPRRRRRPPAPSHSRRGGEAQPGRSSGRLPQTPPPPRHVPPRRSHQHQQDQQQRRPALRLRPRAACGAQQRGRLRP